MRLIDVMVTMEADGLIRIPRPEMESMGLMEGDQICLSYLALEDNSAENSEKEFILERGCDSQSS